MNDAVALEDVMLALAMVGDLSMGQPIDQSRRTARLAQWLAQVRINARLLPLDTQLTRDPATAGWNGTVVFSGPGLAGGN